MMPDDTEIVFNTSINTKDCRPIGEKDLSYRSETEWCKKEKTGGEEPIYRHYLIVNCNPYFAWKE